LGAGAVPGTILEKIIIEAVIILSMFIYYVAYFEYYTL